jgi:energy-coupling factor transporter ATP-binding protein EcfA2
MYLEQTKEFSKLEEQKKNKKNILKTNPSSNTFIWDLMNNALKKYDAGFSIEVPKDIMDEASTIKFLSKGYEIAFKILSSGEKVLFSIISWYVLTQYRGERITNYCLLLDEIDSHFHPEFTEKLFEVIKQLIDINNVTVIMTTHNPATVKLAEKNEVKVYIMDKESDKLVINGAVNARQAISFLSNSLLTVVEDINYVLVENTDDAKFYDWVYKKLLSASYLQKLGSKLIFFPIGVKTVNAEFIDNLNTSLDELNNQIEAGNQTLKEKVTTIKAMVQEVRGSNDSGGGSSQIEKRMEVMEYKVNADNLGIIKEEPSKFYNVPKSETTWALIDRDK